MLPVTQNGDWAAVSWETGEPLVETGDWGEHKWIAMKDPSIVKADGRWHLFATVRPFEGELFVCYSTFRDWEECRSATRTKIDLGVPYYCAPQVFYFAPEKQWYLICQASDPSWDPVYQPAFSTNPDISDPNGWTRLKPLGANKTDEGKTGLDFWIICDNSKAHFFFTTLDGHMWREETSLDDFPHGWSKAHLALEGDVFEASHVYKLRGADRFLTLIEANGPQRRRYYKAYLADSLDGEWAPVAAASGQAFAFPENVRQTGRHWTDSFSHGELLRTGSDQHLEVDPTNLELLFQGASDTDISDRKYGMIPWKLGKLRLVAP